jgi:hypothetical protein
MVDTLKWEIPRRNFPDLRKDYVILCHWSGHGEQHTSTMKMLGNKITCSYGGNKKIEATDDTFKAAGRVGLWTRADSVTTFDDLKVTAKCC